MLLVSALSFLFLYVSPVPVQLLEGRAGLPPLSKMRAAHHQNQGWRWGQESRWMTGIVEAESQMYARAQTLLDTNKRTFQGGSFGGL